MILKLAEYHCYNERAVAQMAEHLDKPMTFEEFAEFAAKMDVAISSSEDGIIYICHPSSW